MIADNNGTQTPQRTRRHFFSACSAGFALFVVISATVFTGCNRAARRPERCRECVVEDAEQPVLQTCSAAPVAATRLGVDLVVQAADREADVERQMQIIENLL